MDMKLVNALVKIRIALERTLSKRGESVKSKKLLADFEHLRRMSTFEEFNEYLKRVK